MKYFKAKKIILPLAILAIAAAPFLNFSDANDAEAIGSSFCKSEACKAAEAAELEATAKANNATSEANTLNAEIARLNDEIKMYETRIAANEARAEDLAIQIEENTKKLNLQQKALANMLVNIHFNNNLDTIMILASSKSISDFAEKQERINTAKTEVNESAQAVKSLKEDLERQKAEVDRIIADQEIQKRALDSKREYARLLATQYANDAAKYSADAEAARQKQQEEIEKARQEMIRQLGTGQIVSGGFNTYPAAAECPQGNLNGFVYGGYKCQCVSYTGWMAYNAYGIATNAWGNANTWDNTARALGYRVDGNPEVGSIAQTDAGYYGHVMWVEDVYADGTVLISEYNGAKYADFSMRKISAAGYNFIHLR